MIKDIITVDKQHQESLEEALKEIPGQYEWGIISEENGLVSYFVVTPHAHNLFYLGLSVKRLDYFK